MVPGRRLGRLSRVPVSVLDAFSVGRLGEVGVPSFERLVVMGSRSGRFERILLGALSREGLVARLEVTRLILDSEPGRTEGRPARVISVGTPVGGLEAVEGRPVMMELLLLYDEVPDPEGFVELVMTCGRPLLEGGIEVVGRLVEVMGLTRVGD